jgi:hypothetical protein
MQKFKRAHAHVRAQGEGAQCYIFTILQFYSARVILCYLQFYNFVTFKLRATTEQMPALVLKS